MKLCNLYNNEILLLSRAELKGLKVCNTDLIIINKDKKYMYDIEYFYIYTNN